MKRREFITLFGTTIFGGTALAWPFVAQANDPLLDETVSFNGEILYLESKVPALVIGVIRKGQISIHGFGRRSDEVDEAPHADTLLRLGSITKAFTGEVLGSLASDGTLAFADPLTKYVPSFASPSSARPIRLIDLVTHSAGLPREVPRDPGPPNNPFATITLEAFSNWLKANPLLFAPGTSILYSNFGFDLLAAALAAAAKKPYPEVLEARITRPLGLADTTFAPSAPQAKRMMQGHDFDGKALPDVPTGSVIVGSGGLYSTPGNMLRWLQWHLDRFSQDGAEERLLDHAAYLWRDGLNAVLGMDESGHMDAMGLGWVVMMPKGDRPPILQKAGGLQGIFSYVAFAPTHDIGVFVAINKFDFGAGINMAKVANDLIASLAPR